MSRCVLKSPWAICWAKATPLNSGRVIVRVMAMATAIPMRVAAAIPITRTMIAVISRPTVSVVTAAASLKPSRDVCKAPSSTTSAVFRCAAFTSAAFHHVVQNGLGSLEIGVPAGSDCVELDQVISCSRSAGLARS